MATVEVYGAGAVWEEDPTFDDRVGLFRWKLEIRQAGRQIFWDIEKIEELGGYDGFYSFVGNIDAGSIDWPCAAAARRGPGKPDREQVPRRDDGDEDESDDVVLGKRILVASVAQTPGSNAAWSVSGQVSGSRGSVEGGLGVEFTPGYDGQRHVWQCKLEVCPRADGCPRVDVITHTATVSDVEYFWGDWVVSADKEFSAVRRRQPEVCVGRCDVRVDATEVLLPLVCGRGTRNSAA